MTIAEALGLVEQGGERFWESELYRLKGDLLLAHHPPDELQAEANLHRAVDIAKRQHAKSFELRVATTLARLWARQGKRTEARGLLADVYGWFTEGFDTPDLKEAKAFLEELA